MRIIIIISIQFLFLSMINGQNLVKNPGFEDFCQNATITGVCDWYDPGNGNTGWFFRHRN